MSENAGDVSNPTRRPSSSAIVLPTNLKDDRIRVENLSSSRAIKGEELSSLLKLLDTASTNEERLKLIESQKVGFLFSSDDLIALVSITESVKTKMAIITAIGPRLIDPKAKPDAITGLFRYSEEKEKVLEVLKSRSLSLGSTKQYNTNLPTGLGNGGGRVGGRGSGLLLTGRGRGSGRSHVNIPSGGRGGAKGNSFVTHSTNGNEDADDAPVKPPDPGLPSNDSRIKHASTRQLSDHGDKANSNNNGIGYWGKNGIEKVNKADVNDSSSNTSRNNSQSEAKSSWFSFSWSSHNSGRVHDIGVMNNNHQGVSPMKTPNKHNGMKDRAPYSGSRTPSTRSTAQFYSTSPFREILRQKTPFLKVDPHPSLSPTPPASSSSSMSSIYISPEPTRSPYDGAKIMLSTGMDKDYNPTKFSTVAERTRYFLSNNIVLPRKTISLGAPQTEWYDQEKRPSPVPEVVVPSLVPPQFPSCTVLSSYHHNRSTTSSLKYINKSSPTGCIFTYRWAAPVPQSPEYLDELIDHPQWQRPYDPPAVKQDSSNVYRIESQYIVDPTKLLNMKPSEIQPIYPSTDRVVVSFQELIRRNFMKEYEGNGHSLDSRNLEKYLSDNEFLEVFQLRHEDFEKMPHWKQKELKKKAHLL